MTPTPEQIAAGLSRAQRRVLCLLADWGTNPYGYSTGELATSIATPNSLWSFGLATGSQVYGGPWSFNITDRGLAVRAIIKGPTQ